MCLHGEMAAAPIVASTTGVPPLGTWKTREANGRGFIEADAYPTSWLESQQVLFSRLV